MIQRNHMMPAHRLSDVRHSELLGSLSFLPARRLLGHQVNEPWRTTVPVNYCACALALAEYSSHCQTQYGNAHAK
jgi:hypothetical protein